MFEQVVTEPCGGCGGDLPVDVDLEQAWERLLADTDLKGAPDPVPGSVPGWLDDQPAGFGSCAPSGFLALDLDSATADPVQLSDHTLIEAMVGSTGWRRGRRPARLGCSPSSLAGGRRIGRRTRPAGPGWAVSTPRMRRGWRCTCPGPLRARGSCWRSGC